MQLYAFGCNNEGQLGVGPGGPEASESPLEIAYTDSADDPVVKMSAGSMHSMALTESGHVLVWGSNKEGQLGLGDEGEENEPTPKFIDFNEKVVEISCGYYHSAFVTESGDLYTFGESEGGKLGLEDLTKTHLPRKVDMPEKVSENLNV